MKKSFGLTMLALAAIATLAEAAPAPRWAVGVLPSGHEFALEVAADDATRGRGYMGRESVGRRDGMLFIFDASDRHSFWMKNCKVALDIVWLDSDERVVWIEANRKPCPADGECPSIVPAAPARYVVEFAAGTVATESLKLGDALVVLSDPPLR
jgi:uncharacterized protein